MGGSTRGVFCTPASSHQQEKEKEREHSDPAGAIVEDRTRAPGLRLDLLLAAVDEQLDAVHKARVLRG